jgi:RNA recognition motif-containing protein
MTWRTIILIVINFPSISLTLAHFCFLIGTAFVIYEDIYDARNACTHLSGFNVKGRYVVVSYYKSDVATQEKDKKDVKKQLEELGRIAQEFDANRLDVRCDSLVLFATKQTMKDSIVRALLESDPELDGRIERKHAEKLCYLMCEFY